MPWSVISSDQLLQSLPTIFSLYGGYLLLTIACSHLLDPVYDFNRTVLCQTVMDTSIVFSLIFNSLLLYPTISTGINVLMLFGFIRFIRTISYTPLPVFQFWSRFLPAVLAQALVLVAICADQVVLGTAFGLAYALFIGILLCRVFPYTRVMRSLQREVVG